MQYTKNDKCDFDFVQFYLDYLFHLPLSLYFLDSGTNNYVFGAIFRIPLPLIFKNKVVRQMTGFWMINSHFGEF